MNSPETFDGSLAGGAAAHNDVEGIERGIEYTDDIKFLAAKQGQLTERLAQATTYLDLAKQDPSSNTFKNLVEVLQNTRAELVLIEEEIKNKFFDDAVATGRKIDQEQQKTVDQEK